MNAVIAYGSTPSGNTNWQQYGGASLFVDVDTSEAGFSSTPKYVTSMGGRTQHWEIVGASSIYSPTPSGFRIYIRPSDDGLEDRFTPQAANSRQWHINWIGIAAAG